MKRLLFLVTFLVICYSISAQDFRKASWGNSKALVKASETGVEWEEAASGIYEVISFDTYISGLNTSVVYVFVGDKLVRTKYSFQDSHSNRTSYITDFNNIGESLQTKYGESELKEIWKDDLYKDDPSDYGMAIAVGHYIMYRQWEIPSKTSISHILTGDNYEITHVVEYSSLALKDYEDQKKKEAEADVF